MLLQTVIIKILLPGVDGPASWAVHLNFCMCAAYMSVVCEFLSIEMLADETEIAYGH